MFRNRELMWGAAVHVALTAVLCLVMWRGLGAPEAAVLCGAGSLVFLALWLGVNGYRYRRLQKLSAYLKEIIAGHYWLEPLQNEEGELSILKSDIYKMAVNLRTQAELLKKDKGYLADTLSDISHQLKTPMTSLMVMTELLADGTLPEEKRQQFAERIHSQLGRMEWLISSLLKMSKLDAGTVVFKREMLRAADVVAKAAEHLLIPMELKGLDFVVETGDVTFLGDPDWTAEGLANLLKNCLEHTSEGGRVRVTAAERNLYTEICVEDTGEGISPEDLPHIFERFYRGKNASTDSVGIGLAMAKHIMERQNGVIEVESEPGRGTCFRVKLYQQII